MKYMDLEQFHEDGYLQEVNRLFFHGLGLALALIVDGAESDDAGKTRMAIRIWDGRDDPEGFLFAELTEADAKRAVAIRELRDSKMVVREKTGQCFNGVQKLPWSEEGEEEP